MLVRGHAEWLFRKSKSWLKAELWPSLFILIVSKEITVEKYWKELQLDACQKWRFGGKNYCE
jgi:hypothetical protein